MLTTPFSSANLLHWLPRVRTHQTIASIWWNVPCGSFILTLASRRTGRTSHFPAKLNTWGGVALLNWLRGYTRFLVMNVQLSAPGTVPGDLVTLLPRVTLVCSVHILLSCVKWLEQMAEVPSAAKNKPHAICHIFSTLEMIISPSASHTITLIISTCIPLLWYRRLPAMKIVSLHIAGVV